jgi:hypothetical protein
MPEPESLCCYRLILPANQVELDKKAVDDWRKIAITLIDRVLSRLFTSTTKETGVRVSNEWT